MARDKAKASFVSPMLLLGVTALPEGEDWQYELKREKLRDGLALRVEA